MGTKLRALYQRKKGRDLFDMYKAMQYGVDPDRVMQCYKRYMDFVVENPPSYKQFIQNMEAKMRDSKFIGDIQGLLRTEERFESTHSQEAYEQVREMFIDKLKGK